MGTNMAKILDGGPFGVFKGTILNGEGESDHRTEYESIFYHIAFFFGLTVHVRLRLSNANLSSTILRFISRAVTPRRAEQSTICETCQ